MVIRANNTSHVKECYNDDQDYEPAREAYHEALDVKWELLLPREMGVGHVCHWVDMRDTLELLAKIFCVMLDNIVVP